MGRITQLQEKAPALLRKLRYHHLSQAKEATPPVSKAYNKELADSIDEILDLFDK